MLTSLWSVALTMAVGANPAGYPAGSGYPVPQNGGFSAPPASYGGYPQGGYAAGAPTPIPEYQNYGGPAMGGYGGPMGGGYPGGLPSGGAYPGNEPLFPYDSQLPWMHGYFQEMPAYGGFNYFRPYNYKHVMPQAQTAAGWGMSPTMPYSHQFWHRFKQQAAMSQELSQNARRGSYHVPRSTTRSYAAPSEQPGATQEALPASYVQPSAGNRFPAVDPAGNFGPRGPALNGPAINPVRLMPR